MKHCKECNVDKPTEDFYPLAGRICKECYRARVRHRRATNPAVQAYDRIRGQYPHRIRHNQENTAAWRQRYPERYKAHNAVNNAIRDGKLTRAPACEACGNTGRLEAHHENYERPLDVRWLCPSCHRRGHLSF